LDLDLESSSSSESSYYEQEASRKKKLKDKRMKLVRSVAVAVDEVLYALTCTSNYVTTTKSLKVPMSKLNVIVDSRAGQPFKIFEVL